MRRWMLAPQVRAVPSAALGHTSPLPAQLTLPAEDQALSKAPELQGLIQARSISITVGSLDERFLNQIMFHILLL